MTFGGESTGEGWGDGCAPGQKILYFYAVFGKN